MAKLTFNIEVEMEDGTAYRVTADQRDLVRWERHPDGGAVTAANRHTCQRFLAWSALQRTGETILKWPLWDARCVEALEKEADTADDAGDPGPLSVSATPT